MTLTLELITVSLAVGALLCRFAWRGGAPWLLAAASTAMLVALFVNPARWPLYPAVIGLALAALLVLRPQRFAIGYAIAGAVLLALSALLALAFALPQLPAPSGPYAVGTVTTELQRSAPEGPRRLFLKIWYPARAAAGAAEGLWSDLPAMTDVPWVFRGGLAYLTRARTHSHRAARYAPGAGPARVVLYNHSFVSWASENSLLAEELASRGAVVVAIRHLGQVDEYGQLNTELREDTRRVAGRIVDRRTADGRLVADRLDEVLGAIPAMTGERPGTYAAMGFSLGGAVSTQMCLEDRRCTAVVNIDGGIPGVDYPRLPVPHYLMIAGRRKIGLSDALPAGAEGGYRQRAFPKAEHADFHDSAVALPVTRWFFGRSGAELAREKRDLAGAIADFLASAAKRPDAIGSNTGGDIRAPDRLYAGHVVSSHGA